jgi:hypothetical protein
MNKYHLTKISNNAKTGPIAVSTSSKSTCPDDCPIKEKGCYAGNGPLNLHWQKVTNGERGVSFDDFLLQVGALPIGSEYRHNQAGDLPGENGQIDAPKLNKLAKTTKNRKLRAFTYTHYNVLTNINNRLAIQAANNDGFTINLSANHINEVDNLLALKIAPVAVIMPINAPKVSYTAAGNKIVICPAQTNDETRCIDCMLCAKNDRSFSIGFIAHGTSAKKAALATNNLG